MELVLVVSTLFVLSIITTGIYYIYKGTSADEVRMRKILRFNLLGFLPILFFVAVTIVPGFVQAQAEGNRGTGLGYIAAGLSTGLAALGAGVAVANVGSSAIGAVSEDPKILGKSMLFLGLAEGIAIYGLIISIMILGRL